MNFEVYSLAAIIILSFSALILLISHDWRLIIGALGTMYVGIFILVSISWRLEMAVIKLVAGWISASVLGISIFSGTLKGHHQFHHSLNEMIFRFSAAGLVGLVTISISPGVQSLMKSAANEQVLGGVILLGMGLLHLGFSSQPLDTIVGLLTFMGGFEVLYATFESSILVSGFLAIINMMIALVGAYLLLASTLESDE